jgi:hypothetical protein
MPNTVSVGCPVVAAQPLEIQRMLTRVTKAVFGSTQIHLTTVRLTSVVDWGCIKAIAFIYEFMDCFPAVIYRLSAHYEERSNCIRNTIVNLKLNTTKYTSASSE